MLKEKNLIKLKNRVIFQNLTQNQDEYGNIVNLYSDIKEVWASVDIFSYSDTFIYLKKDIQFTHKIKVKFDNEIIDAKRVIINNSKILDIYYIQPEDSSNKYFNIYCKEIIL